MAAVDLTLPTAVIPRAKNIINFKYNLAPDLCLVEPRYIYGGVYKKRTPLAENTCFYQKQKKYYSAVSLFFSQAVL